MVGLDDDDKVQVGCFGRQTEPLGSGKALVTSANTSTPKRVLPWFGSGGDKSSNKPELDSTDPFVDSLHTNLADLKLETDNSTEPITHPSGTGKPLAQHKRSCSFGNSFGYSRRVAPVERDVLPPEAPHGSNQNEDNPDQQQLGLDADGDHDGNSTLEQSPQPLMEDNL